MCVHQVAKNNVMRTGILSSKIGLTKRFEAAWKDPECDRIYEHLRREMEIDRRYDDLEVKVREAVPCCIHPHQGPLQPTLLPLFLPDSPLWPLPTGCLAQCEKTHYSSAVIFASRKSDSTSTE